MPLSLQYQLDKYGFYSLIKDIKDLYEQEKIELTSSAAYHSLLPKVSSVIAERQIILNEYGLGYYFGKDKGFEGEDALMLKNVVGFFPPELASSHEVLELVNSLGYQWLLADQCAFYERPEYNPVYALEGMDTKVVCRHTALSNLLSFKRDPNTEDIIDCILGIRNEGKDVVVALDGEYFGHHNKEGIFVLDVLCQQLTQLGINLVTISELMDNSSEVPIKYLPTSTWGATANQIKEGLIYPLWENKDSVSNNALWAVFNKVLEFDHILKVPKSIDYSALHTFPIWDLAKLQNTQDAVIVGNLTKEILYLQSLNSDQFWWSSKATVFDTILDDPRYVHEAFESYKDVARSLEEDELEKYIEQQYVKIKHLL